MAVGDVTRVWSASTEIAWSSGGPASLADAAFTGLTDEVDADAGGAKVLDIQVAAKVTTAAGSPATQAHVAIWAATPADDSNYGGSANWILVGVCFVPTAATAAWPPKFSLAAAFGGALPKLFKLALENRTGLALAAGADDCIWLRPSHYPRGGCASRISVETRRRNRAPLRRPASSETSRSS